MRGLKTDALTETVLYTVTLNTAISSKVGINFTGYASYNTYQHYWKVRRDSLTGPILFEAQGNPTTETLFANAMVDMGSGVFVFTGWSGGAGEYTILGNRCGVIAGWLTFKPTSTTTVIPIKVGVSQMKIASLINACNVNGFQALASTLYTMPTSNMFFSQLTVMQASLHSEEFIAISITGIIITVS